MGMVEWFEFQVPGKVICAEHCVDSVGMEMDRIGGRRALIVTDRGSRKRGSCTTSSTAWRAAAGR